MAAAGEKAELTLEGRWLHPTRQTTKMLAGPPIGCSRAFLNSCLNGRQRPKSLVVFSFLLHSLPNLFFILPASAIWEGDLGAPDLGRCPVALGCLVRGFCRQEGTP